jgi:hypothetical protein
VSWSTPFNEVKEMQMHKIRLGWLMGMSLGMSSPAATWAAGELHLSFHMGGTSGEQSFVGGTLINEGDAPVVHGYVVVTLLDAQCRPLKSVLGNFDEIPVGQARSFRVPLEGALQRYRLASVKGFDAQGFEVPSIDDNQKIIKAREVEERAYCAEAQAKAEN